MTAEQALEAGKNLDFAQVWTALMETREQMRQMSARADKTSADIDKLFKTVNSDHKMLGGVSNDLGSLEEALFAAQVWELFPKYHLRMAYKNIPIYGKNAEWKGEIDLLLVNTEYAMAIEVKSHAKIDDIEYHIRRMELIRKYPPLEFKAPKLLGAIAAGYIGPEVKEAAIKAGFYVIEFDGKDLISLLKTPEGFKPKEW
jgi:hypothetical protein